MIIGREKQMNNQVLVSIITPCFNSKKTIARTFDALMRQSYQNMEYIVIDGGSTDGTLDVISEYEKKFPFPFRYVSEPDEGIYDAMNKPDDKPYSKETEAVVAQEV